MSGRTQELAVTSAAKSGSSIKEIRLRSGNCILGKLRMSSAALDCLANPLFLRGALALSRFSFLGRHALHSKVTSKVPKPPAFSIFDLRFEPKAVVLEPHFEQWMCGCVEIRPVSLRSLSSLAGMYFIVLMISEPLLLYKLNNLTLITFIVSNTLVLFSVVGKGEHFTFIKGWFTGFDVVGINPQLTIIACTNVSREIFHHPQCYRNQIDPATPSL